MVSLCAWLRSPIAGISYNVRLVYTDGSETNNNAYHGDNGLRPASVETATQ